MKLYLLRHAEAEALAPSDSLRALTERGQRDALQLGKWLGEQGLLPGSLKLLEHSRLVRARQTAEAVQGASGHGLTCGEVDGLAPEDAPEDWARRLNERDETTFLIGHNPHLEGLFSLLLTGKLDPPAVVLKKCGLVHLERVSPADRERPLGWWRLRWHVVPRLLPGPPKRG